MSYWEGIAKYPPACSANSSIIYMGSFYFIFVMLRKFIGFCIEHNITSATVVYGILDAKCN